MKYIVELQPEDLFVFRKYIDSAIAQGFFDEGMLIENKTRLFNFINSLATHDEPLEGITCMQYLQLVR